MIRRLLALVAVLVGAVALALVLAREPGYVLIAAGPWRVETSLAFLVAALLVLGAGLWLLVRAVAGLWRLPGAAARRRRRRRTLRAREGLVKGLIALAEGRWAEAERLLVRSAPDSETPLLNWLGAARAAQQQGAHDRRDDHLRRAHESMPAADVAVGLTQAELQIAHRQLEQALATLTHLRGLAPRHAHVLKLLARLYRELRDWDHLLPLLPELRRRRVLDAEALRALEREVHLHRMARAAEDTDARALEAAWAEVPRALREDPELARARLTHLVAVGREAEAEREIRRLLRRRWDERLVWLYGLLGGGDAQRRLAEAERWLGRRDRDATLLLTLGRLAARAGLWGKARGYLEASLGLARRAETARELAEVLDRMGEHEAAAQRRREGLELALQEAGLQAPGRTALPPPAVPERLPGAAVRS